MYLLRGQSPWQIYKRVSKNRQNPEVENPDNAIQWHSSSHYWLIIQDRVPRLWAQTTSYTVIDHKPADISLTGGRYSDIRDWMCWSATPRTHGNYSYSSLGEVTSLSPWSLHHNIIRHHKWSNAIYTCSYSDPQRPFLWNTFLNLRVWYSC